MASDGPNVTACAGPLAEHAVTLGLATIARAREVVVIVSGQGKRRALERLTKGPSASTPRPRSSEIIRAAPCWRIGTPPGQQNARSSRPPVSWWLDTLSP